jgi:lysophospholipase L1-like esterase
MERLTVKIAFLGASLTEGSYGGSYVDALRARLPEHELLNFGVNGSTILQLQQRLDSVLDAAPDAVFVLGGSNDAIAYSQPKTRSYYKQVQGMAEGFITPAEFGQHYRELITRLQIAHVHTLIGLPPLEHNPVVAAAAVEFNHVTREVARAFNLPVCDLAAAMIPHQIPDRKALDMSTILIIGDRVKSGWNDYETEQARGGYTYSFDGIHFTPQGAQQAAAIIAAFLRENL